jgi:CPA2 family monovalent cation:H+ antiporter-2
MAYFGHLNRLPVLESLKVEESSSIIITVQSEHKKRLISEAVLEYYEDAKIVLKINTTEERKHLKDLGSIDFVDSNYEMSFLMINHALKYK